MELYLPTPASIWRAGRSVCALGV